MCAAGAKGTTRTQIIKALYAQSLAKLNTQSQNICNNIIKPLSDQIMVADQLYAALNITIKQSYIKTLTKYYSSNITELDFVNAPVGAVDAINNWVANKTNNLLPTIIAPGDVNALTRLIIINCLYFKAQWLTPFQTTATTNQTFYLVNGSTTQVPMMSSQGLYEYFNASASIQAQIINIPFNTSSKRLSLVFTVILPDNNSNLTTVQQKLTNGILNTAFTSNKSKYIVLSLPKFKSEAKYELTNALQQLGIKAVFDQQKADLSGITPTSTPNLSVTKVSHGAVIDVNEAGVEAAAATAVIIGLTSVNAGEALQFNCNRPFLYMIREKTTGLLLFIGKYTGVTVSAYELSMTI
ncbi:unnamed protein product [Didymodactylos carnosus]|uniref:Serpin domain-containing protein n=1 Tax=Didymodactylos carnosus TaxID=1234261 RepID=A0A814JFF8_9BILA|nr:unnamed protein product [Didymodactylos carnosus]CAF1036873.1 unnamed protein product [Didymodactylos carnosus]CAF3782594.1 unnamed protein product [Didymodactylos carnosus]CAF3807495.1 unnamed protein product [Didymodactylos carnosus]